MTRTMYDSLDADALPDLPGTLVAVYPDHPQATNPGRHFNNARVVEITVHPDTRPDLRVADVGDQGDYTPQSFAAEVQGRHQAGDDTFSGYWDDAIDGDVRAALAAVGRSDFDFSTRRWRAAWLAPGAIAPDGPSLGCVAWQYGGTAYTGHDYDVSVVADDWPAVDGAAPAPQPAPQPAPAPGSWPTESYTVQPGDTEYVIAQRHQMTLAELEQLNPHSGHPPGDFGVIWPGDTLTVRAPAGGPPAPPPAPPTTLETYTVVHGDTLSAIAAAHHMTLGELEALNPRAGHPPGDFSMIWPGDRLIVHA